MSDETTDEESDADRLTIDADTIAASNSPGGQEPLRCPRCDTPIGLIVSYGPITHRATPCGCPIPADYLERRRDDSR